MSVVCRDVHCLNSIVVIRLSIIVTIINVIINQEGWTVFMLWVIQLSNSRFTLCSQSDGQTVKSVKSEHKSAVILSYSTLFRKQWINFCISKSWNMCTGWRWMFLTGLLTYEILCCPPVVEMLRWNRNKSFYTLVFKEYRKCVTSCVFTFSSFLFQTRLLRVWLDCWMFIL